MTKFFIATAIILTALTAAPVSAAETELVIIVTPHTLKHSQQTDGPTRFGTFSIRERGNGQRTRRSVRTRNRSNRLRRATASGTRKR